jgi:hypothetical protein
MDFVCKRQMAKPQLLNIKGGRWLFPGDDMRILFKTADCQFLSAQNKMGAFAISPA